MSATVVTQEFDVIVNTNGGVSVNGVAVVNPAAAVIPSNSVRAFLHIQNKSADIVTFKFDSAFITPTTGVQTLKASSTPTGGTFTLSYNGQETTALQYNAASSDIQTAMQALSTVGSNNMTVAGTWPTFTFTGAANLALTPLYPIGVVTNSLTDNTNMTSAIQNINWSAAPASGTFKVSFRGIQTPALAWNISAANLAVALNALASINGGVDTVAQDPISLNFAVSFAGAPTANQPLPLMVVDSSGLLTTVGQSTGVFKIYAASAPQSGNYALQAGGHTTTLLAYNALAATIQTALRALPGMSGNVTVAAIGTDGNLVQGFTLTLGSGLANTTFAPIISDDNFNTLSDNGLGGDDADDAPDHCVIHTVTITPAQGPVGVTNTVINDTVGGAALAVSLGMTVNIVGEASLDDGIQLTAVGTIGSSQLYDAECPTGALFMKSTGATSPVTILAG